MQTTPAHILAASPAIWAKLAKCRQVQHMETSINEATGIGVANTTNCSTQPTSHHKLTDFVTCLLQQISAMLDAQPSPTLSVPTADSVMNLTSPIACTHWQAQPSQLTNSSAPNPISKLHAMRSATTARGSSLAYCLGNEKWRYLVACHYLCITWPCLDNG